ncbi:hypothetical protein [Paenarthrobacter nitroguajacolicus]|uniref:hypothetical protein n=1 Tax=Paenarthrobacter nitroguajacolicus TaxID=211146 RepID=UPI002857B373|nr:hypothetical protein [Paenarthrobacter nitroguajacolicus]MDR6636963.1 hypothetical protein [Paenarthrobacter nitroguajacolicus]
MYLTLRNSTGRVDCRRLPTATARRSPYRQTPRSARRLPGFVAAIFPGIENSLAAAFEVSAQNFQPFTVGVASMQRHHVQTCLEIVRNPVEPHGEVIIAFADYF